MFQSVIVPLDGSRLAEAAILYGAALAARLGASSLTLLHVVTQDATADEEAAARRYLDERARAVSAAGFQAQTSIRLGKPEAQIVAAAEAATEPVIVLAAEAHGGLSGLFHEDLAAHLVHHGRVPVLVVRAAPETIAIDAVMVPLDGSAFAESALPYGQALARAFGAELHLVRVAATTQVYGLMGTDPLAPASAGALTEITDEMSEEARAFVAREAERVSGAGYRVTGQALIGDPAGQLLAYARERGIDLIVMSTHGQGGLMRALFGSVAQQVLRETPVPVLLIQPRGELRDEQPATA